MADLQDTNAATEEIYGPLLIVDCPVTRRDDFSKPPPTDGGRLRGKALFSFPAASFIHHVFGLKPL